MNWHSYDRQAMKETLALCKQYEQQGLYTEDECYTKALEQIEKFETTRWTRVIQREIRFELLRNKLREEAGLPTKTPATKEKKQLAYAIDLTFPEHIENKKRLEISKEFYTELDTDFELTIEQRGHTIETCGNGLHIHANCFNKPLTLQEVKHKTKNILNSHKLKPNIIEFKCLSTHEHIENRKKYIRGNKKGTDKDGIDKSIKVSYDNTFRERHNLADIYTHLNIKDMIFTNNRHDNTHEKPEEMPSPSPKTAYRNDRPILAFT